MYDCCMRSSSHNHSTLYVSELFLATLHGRQDGIEENDILLNHDTRSLR